MINDRNERKGRNERKKARRKEERKEGKKERKKRKKERKKERRKERKEQGPTILLLPRTVCGQLRKRLFVIASGFLIERSFLITKHLSENLERTLNQS